ALAAAAWARPAGLPAAVIESGRTTSVSSKINEGTRRARRNRSRRLVAIGLAGLACLPLGCQSVLELPEWPPSLLADDPEPKLPDRMMVIWSDTVLHQPQQPGVRGFGGRIYFYQGNDPKPVIVDGGLAVY